MIKVESYKIAHASGALHTAVGVPAFGDTLSVDVYQGDIYVNMLVDDSYDFCDEIFLAITTGTKIERPEDYKFIGSVREGGEMIHVFRLRPGKAGIHEVSS